MKHWKIWITAAAVAIGTAAFLMAGCGGQKPAGGREVSECQNHRRCITGTTWRNPERNQAHAYR